MSGSTLDSPVYYSNSTPSLFIVSYDTLLLIGWPVLLLDAVAGVSWRVVVEHSSRHCPSSDSLRQRRCVPGPCPVWDDWSEWSECSSCSRYHMRTRSRQCILHSSSSSANCEGESRVEESCDLWCGLAGLSNVHPEIELITGKGRRRGHSCKELVDLTP
ncbi:hypothetical protein RB195_024395 [Necator americanus]|uniref:Thrombospondin type 1 domain protein n=1 Tax=Necator americanus TaxID=51031 RepID=A0ABR1EN39_NECAM